MAGDMRRIGFVFLMASAVLGATSGTDSGYVFLGPHIVEGSVPLKDGTVVEAIHQQGVVVSQSPGSPWHHATFFAQGSRVKLADGKVVGDVLLRRSLHAQLGIPLANPVELNFSCDTLSFSSSLRWASRCSPRNPLVIG